MNKARSDENQFKKTAPNLMDLFIMNTDAGGQMVFEHSSYQFTGFGTLSQCLTDL